MVEEREGGTGDGREDEKGVERERVKGVEGDEDGSQGVVLVELRTEDVGVNLLEGGKRIAP